MPNVLAADLDRRDTEPQSDLDTMFPSLSATFEDTAAPVWVTNLAGRPVYTNPSGARLLGDGQAPIRLPNARSALGEMLEDVSQSHRPTQRRTRLDGQDFDTLATPLQDHHGRTVAALLTFQPVG